MTPRSSDVALLVQLTDEASLLGRVAQPQSSLEAHATVAEVALFVCTSIVARVWNRSLSDALQNASYLVALYNKVGASTTED